MQTINAASATALQERIQTVRAQIDALERDGLKKTDRHRQLLSRLNTLVSDRERLLKDDDVNKTEFRVRGYTVFAAIVLLADALQKWERQASDMWPLTVTSPDGQRRTELGELVDIEMGLMSEIYKIVEKVGGNCGVKFAEEFADMVDEPTNQALNDIMQTLRDALITRHARRLLYKPIKKGSKQ